jgi:hypothetical protein
MHGVDIHGARRRETRPVLLVDCNCKEKANFLHGIPYFRSLRKAEESGVVWLCLAEIGLLVSSMSARRQYSDKHTLPDNPSWIDFVRSDGDENRWPTNTTREVDAQGHVNYMRPVPLDEPGLSVKWRIEVAVALAVLLNLPGTFFFGAIQYKRLTLCYLEGPPYVLREWPRGYRMYDHLKGPQDAPRHDIYLFGKINHSRPTSLRSFIPFRLEGSIPLCPRNHSACVLAHERSCPRSSQL